MKKRIAFPILTFFVLVLSAFQNHTHVDFPSNKGFLKGEKITYHVHYGFISAGNAIVKMDDKLHAINGKNCYKVDIEGTSSGIVSLSYKIKDLWRSYIDVETLTPQQFYRNINENSYKKVETVNFDHKGRKAFVKSKTKNNPEKEANYDIPAKVQDMVSGYFQLRNVEFTNLKKGDIIKVDAFFESKVYDFKLRFLGRERIKTKVGKFDTFVLQPIMPETSIFDGSDAIKFWMSDDDYRIPLKIRAEMFVGAVEVEVTDYKNEKVHWKH